LSVGGRLAGEPRCSVASSRASAFSKSERQQGGLARQPANVLGLPREAKGVSACQQNVIEGLQIERNSLRAIGPGQPNSDDIAWTSSSGPRKPG
jgi:hypothetical protein